MAPKEERINGLLNAFAQQLENRRREKAPFNVSVDAQYSSAKGQDNEASMHRAILSLICDLGKATKNRPPPHSGGASSILEEGRRRNRMKNWTMSFSLRRPWQIGVIRRA